jgi:hypothetical protein
MEGYAWTILLSAAGVALVHTVLGPDHTLPFVMLGRARGWSIRKTLWVTLVCGAGHVASSLVLGGVGLALGVGLSRLEALEGLRGGWAAWALIAVGFAYALWGVRVAIRSRAGLLPHEHQGHVHVHRHGHHAHTHEHPNGSRATFWVLFTVFVLGPCEPLILFFMEPASRGLWGLAFLTGLVFAVVTLVSMMTLVGVALAGVKRIPLGPLEQWSHALAGSVIALSGLAVVFLGL